MAPIRLFVRSVLALSLISPGLDAQNKKLDFKVPDDVAFRSDHIMSEGTRIAAEIFAPNMEQLGGKPLLSGRPQGQDRLGGCDRKNCNAEVTNVRDCPPYHLSR